MVIKSRMWLTRIYPTDELNVQGSLENLVLLEHSGHSAECS